MQDRKEAFSFFPLFVCFFIFLFIILINNKFRSVTSDLQLALHLILAEVIDSLACVLPSVEQAGLADVQSQDALVVLHEELGVAADYCLVLHPDDLGLDER